MWNLTLFKQPQNYTHPALKWAFILGFAAIFRITLFSVALAQLETKPADGHLRDLADKHGLLIGAAVEAEPWNLPDSAIYQSTLSDEFNIITPIEAFKWSSIHPERGRYNFSYSDRFVALAKAHHMKVHANTLVWHASNPDWLEDLPNAQVEAAMDEHIDALMKHYKGDVLIWDVVNEALHINGQLRTNSKYYAAMGPSYIEKAFKQAAAADPNAILIYNDYKVETLNQKSDGMYNMVVDLLSKGIPIHGVGLQMHIATDFNEFDSLTNNMNRFAALGLDIYITELDIVAPEANDETQAAIYQEILKRCLAQPHCKAFQMWGFTDKYSWKLESSHPLLFDAKYKPKLAYDALQAVLLSSMYPSRNLRSQPIPSKSIIEQSTQSDTSSTELKEGEAKELLSFEGPLSDRYQARIRYLAKSQGLFSINLYINGSLLAVLSYNSYKMDLTVNSSQ